MAKFADLPLLSVGHTINIAGAIYAGEGRAYLCYFPEDRHDLPIEPLEMNADEWATFLKQTDVLETEILTRASDGTLAKAIVRKSARQIEAAISWKVFKRDGYRCRYCGNDDVPLTVDHLICWEEGGPSTADNMVASCKKCNKTRGNLPYGKWLQHPYYLKVSAKLEPAARMSNEAILAMLDRIPRMIHVRTR